MKIMDEKVMAGLPYLMIIFPLLASMVFILIIGDRNVEASFFNILVVQLALFIMCMLSFYHNSQRRYEIEKLEERIEKLESEKVI